MLAETSRLTVPILGATGAGPTVLAAFDDALMSAGVANYNLIRLSSVIPPGSRILEMPAPGSVEDATSEYPGARQAASDVMSDRWGDRLYAVWAFEGAQVLGQEAWAGVAWVQDESDGRGLFVEHEGGSESQVREELRATMESICSARGLSHLKQRSVVVGCRCEGTPVGALVIAPYWSEPWAPT